jgi:hypothetical protein
MLRTSGESAPAAVSVNPAGRRRRAFRIALTAVGFGWAVVIVLMVIGFAIPPTSPHPAIADPPAHQPAATRTTPTVKPSTPAPSQSAPVHRTTAVTHVAPVPVPVTPQQAQTRREFASTPVACQPGSKCRTFGCKNLAGKKAATFTSVQAAFDGRGAVPADNPESGSFDCGGFSYQSNQLAANGFGPGAGVAVAGKVLTLPALASGAPDEIIARGQVIHFNPAHSRTSELGFFGAGAFGNQGGTFTVTYVGGATQTATLQFADWYSDLATPGSVIAASGLWNVPSAQTASFKPAPVSVYYDQIAVSSSKPIASVTLPANPNLHLFDIGVPGPASYRTVASAYNDRGLTTAADSGDGNFDGAGHSYNSTALAAKGLRPGAQVTVRGVKFTWPQSDPGRLDNIRAQGQTVGLTGAGRVLSFLGAATLGTQHGTVIIRYADGASQSAVLSFADWRAGRAADGGTIVATVPVNKASGVGQHQVSVYSATVPLKAGQTVVSVTLPVNIDLHVFAVAEGK